MSPRIACYVLALLSLTACGQAGKLVLPEKAVPPPKSAEVKPVVVDPVPMPDATSTTPAQATPDAAKKEKP